MGTRVQHSTPRSIERARLAVAKELGVPAEHVTVRSETNIDHDWCVLIFRAGIRLPECDA